MSDPTDDTARPAKRARLDDGTAPTLSSTPAPQATSTPAIDEDIEREVRAGITEYVCPNNRGFTGTLKQRYTDFLVNEIGLDGKVLHLRSTEVPRRKKANGQVVEKKSDGKGLEVKEEKVEGDKEMVDVRNGEGGEKEVQDAPMQDGAEGKQNGEAKEELKPAAEEEVGLYCERFHTAVLTSL
jgi:tRNA pseudouridine13 synthase